MIILACIFGLIAGSLAVFPGVATILLCCAVGTGGAVWIIFCFVKRSLPIKLTWLLCVGLLADYCMNSLLNESVAMVNGYGPLAFFDVDTGWAAYAFMLVMLACATLLVAGYLEPPLILERHAVRISSKGERFLWLGLLVIIASFLHGDRSLNGMVTEEGTGRVTLLGSLAGSCQGLIFPLAVVGFMQSTGMRRLRLAVLALASFLSVISEDRRAFVFLFIMTVIAAPSLAGDEWRPRWRISRFGKLVFALTSMVVLAAASFVFYGMRMATWEMGEGTHSMGSVVSTAAATTFQRPGEITAALADNLSDRTAYALRYLSWLGRGGDTPSPMLGADIYQGVRMALPDAVYHLFGKSKDEVRHIGQEEDVANEHFGLPDEDMSNSVLTAGIIDFGVPGTLAYPVLVCLLACVIARLSGHFMKPEGQLVIIFTLMIAFISAEDTIGGYIGALRNTVIAGVVWEFLYRFPGLTPPRSQSLPHGTDLARL